MKYLTLFLTRNFFSQFDHTIYSKCRLQLNAPYSSGAGVKQGLRPRKAVMTLTPEAVSQLKHIYQENKNGSRYLRVGLKHKGCSGLQYALDFVDTKGKWDEIVEQDGVTVLVDSKALMSIIGSEMHYIKTKLSQQFVFNNPNVKESCGCGESFMV